MNAREAARREAERLRGLSDEDLIADAIEQDLITSEHLLHSRPVAADIAHRVLDAVIDDFRRPEKRAGLAAYFAVFVFLSRRGMKFLPAYFAAMGAMQGTEHLYVKAQKLYGMAEDIHGKLTGDATGED